MERNKHKKHNPLPPSFPMEGYNSKSDVVKEVLERITLPVSKDFPKEDLTNSMTIPQNGVKFLWRPNNYRRKLRVKTKSNSGLNSILSVYKDSGFSEHTKIVTIRFGNILLQYGKNFLTAIYSQNIIDGAKEIFLIEASSRGEIDSRIDEKAKEIKDKLDMALFDFAREFKLVIPGEAPVWSRYEDFIKGDEFIDSLPPGCIIHDTLFKKVYSEGLEFKSCKERPEPIASIKQYFKNRVMEDWIPEVALAINGMNVNVTSHLNEFGKNLITHVELLKNISSSFKEFSGSIKEFNAVLSEHRENGKAVSSKELLPHSKTNKPSHSPYLLCSCGSILTRLRGRIVCYGCGRGLVK